VKASRLLGRTITKDRIRSHKIVGSVPLAAEEIFHLQDEVWKDWKTISPTENGIPEALGTLRMQGHEVYVVTSRPQRLMDSVGLWLLFNRIPYDRFLPIGPKVLKVSVPCDALVDDAPEQVDAFVRAGRQGFLYERPWNLRSSLKKAIRIDSLAKVIHYYRTKSVGI
jgi:hypothetical protein